MEQDLDPGTKQALCRIQTMGSLARRLVRRGHDAYVQDNLLALAAEAIMRRLADAVAELDHGFLAAHPEVDWSAMQAAQTVDEGPEPQRTAFWTYLATQLPAELREIQRILDAWWWRPLPGPRGCAGVSTRDAPHASGDLRDQDFRRVVERLDGWTAAASAPSDDGPIDVTYPDGRTARIVVTARDVAEMHVVHGTLDQIMVHFAHSLRSLPDDMPFLVYGRCYDLVPSTEPVLPRWDPTDV